MEQKEYDLVVIGAGPGGYVAAIRAAQLGMSVACIDRGDNLGGTCLNVGCIPSKALLQSTEFYESIQKNGVDLGVEATGIAPNFGVMMDRKGKIVKGLVDGIATHFKKHGIVRYKGDGRFLGPTEIEIIGNGNSDRIRGKNFIVATGSMPIELPSLPFDEKLVVSSTGALSLTSVPKRLLVVGGGVIGVELASVYRRLGSQVTIIEMLPTLTPTMDQSISRTLLQILKKGGLEFYLSAKVIGATTDASSAHLEVEHEGKTLHFSADVVLVAVGRRPFTGGLNLEAAGVKTTPRGFITVDGNFRTSQPHIFAIGDVIEGVMLAHRASHEGIAVADFIRGNRVKVNYMAIPNVIYTHPEVAAVGLTEKEATEAGFKLLIGTSFFRGNGRARCNGDTEGFVKVIGDEVSGRLLGVHIIGPHASELIGEGVIAIEKGATVSDIADAPHAHPTLSETIMEAAQQALGRAIH